MEVIQIDARSWRIEDDFVRFFLLTGEKQALLIDTGATGTRAREIAETLTELPIRLINTHIDGDHTAGNEMFDEVMMSPKEWERYQKKGTLCPVHDGDRIDLGGREIKVIDLPGHTLGSIALLDVGAKILFGGDSIQDGNIFMFGVHRDIRMYRDGLEHLMQEHGDEFQTVYPCHGSFPVKPDLIPKLIDASTQIIEGKAEGQPVELHGTRVLLYPFGFAGFYCELM